MNYNFITGPAGSGKTSGAIVEMSRRVNENLAKFVIAAPSKALQEQHKDSFSRSLNNVDNILMLNSDDCTSVSSEYTKAMFYKAAPVISITHTTLFNNVHVKNKSEYHLIIDELPEVIGAFQFHADYIWDVVNEVAEIIDSPCEGYSFVKIKENKKSIVRKYADNKNDDDMIRQIEPLMVRLIDTDLRIVVPTQAWIAKDKRITFNWFMKPEVLTGWASVTFMAANFFDSLLYKIFSKQNVSFTKSNLVDVVADIPDNVSERAIIAYMSSSNFSRYKLEHGMDITTLSSVANEVIDKKEHIYAINNFTNDNEYVAENGEKIPVKSHGLNSYSHHTNVVNLTALNPLPDHARFMTSFFDLSRDEIKRAGMSEAIYQMVMRSNLRVYDGTENVVIVVVDRTTAYDLKHWLKKATIVSISGTDYVRPAKTAAQCSRTTYEKKTYNGTDGVFVKNLQSFSFESNVQSRIVVQTDFNDWNDIKTVFKNELFNKHVASKHENILFSPASFSSNNSSSSSDFVIHKSLNGEIFKSEANVSQASCLVFDIDGCDVTEQEISNRIPYQHFIYSTHSNGVNGKRKFRIMISLKYAVNTANYKKLVKHVYAMFSDLTNLDVTKMSPASFFYVPVVPAMGMDHIVWIESESRIHLNPEKILPIIEIDDEFKVIDEEIVFNVNFDLSVMKKNKFKGNNIQWAIDRWQNAPAGSGNIEFFKFASYLKYIKMENHEIRNLLNEQYSKNPRVNSTDRYKQIQSIMTSLARS